MNTIYRKNSFKWLFSKQYAFLYYMIRLKYEAEVISTAPTWLKYFADQLLVLLQLCQSYLNKLHAAVPRCTREYSTFPESAELKCPLTFVVC